MKVFKAIFIVFLLSLFLKFPLCVIAADFRAGESIYLSENENKLSDLYLFGSTVTSDAKINEDLTALAGVITLNGDVNGSIFAAGGDIFIRSNSQNTIRAAGGNIIISGKTKNDALLAGGNIRLTETATVEGDLVIFGGDIQIESPVNGKVQIYGGNVLLNNKIKGNVTGNMGTLTLGNKSEIQGDLIYKANNKATLNNGALIKGKHNFQKLEDQDQKQENLNSVISTGSLYKLATDIIATILMIILFPVLIKNILEYVINNPIKSLGSGFLFLVFWPLISVILLFLLFIGLISFLYYGMVLLISLFITKILIGWWILNWWNKRNNKEYILDWQAAVVGSVTNFILLLIPIIGWIFSMAVYLIAIGGITFISFDYLKKQLVQNSQSK